MMRSSIIAVKYFQQFTLKYRLKDWFSLTNDIFAYSVVKFAFNFSLRAQQHLHYNSNLIYTFQQQWNAYMNDYKQLLSLPFVVWKWKFLFMSHLTKY